MARDYKHRVQNPSYGSSRARNKKPPTLWWRWLLVAALIVAFLVFLNMVRGMVAELIAGKPEAAASQPGPAVKQEIPLQQQNPPAAEPEPVQAEEPRYDFYTILPQAETVVPDYEIQTRVREELVGKTKQAKYVMQAGSFREAADAERHKAKLALLGIESWVEKAKVGSVIWHRIKIGPYDNPSSVSTIKELLQKNGIGVIVTEQGK
ncbi:SPOR domain-containing protein [Methylomonas rivi]|uniref:SPOR domain-containing protein n=1 Tax=Methylomonas rivi TaxID=2952226 RepID=A0ABT1U4I0_9GAMM|nr:SPOR domain-containing protein [Methylomonas sp. WSC-6]MCQ8128752.1 SPOR domain-containing protein [Methylomonas sp. WSC-6]